MADYVIVGAGVAGASAASTIRRHDATANVLLIGAEAVPPYERPPLSKGYLPGTLVFEQLLVRPAAFYAEQRIDTMFGARVVRIDASRRIVYIESSA
jgi:NADPH-dependent 2,4-dienoyl-CoA reductase/sulfur reductase-like enzyme